jgi:hypothetical protein
VGGRAPSGPTRALITVSIEKRAPDIRSDLGWTPADPGEVTVVEASPAPDETNSALWQGEIRFKTAPPPGQFRVVIREFEIHVIDPFEGEIVVGGPNFGERLIYASILTWDFAPP